MRKWPWGSEFTEHQAEESAKFLLNLSQATFIGSFGAFFLKDIEAGFQILIFLIGFITGILLYLFAMRLLKEVK